MNLRNSCERSFRMVSKLLRLIQEVCLSYEKCVLLDTRCVDTQMLLLRSVCILLLVLGMKPDNSKGYPYFFFLFSYIILWIEKTYLSNARCDHHQGFACNATTRAQTFSNHQTGNEWMGKRRKAKITIKMKLPFPLLSRVHNSSSFFFFLIHFFRLMILVES